MVKVYRRRKAIRRPKRFAKRLGRSAARRRALGLGTRFLTETLYAGTIYTSTSSGATNVGQLWSTKFKDIPQNADYSNLYRQFCIKSLQLILLPRQGQVDANNMMGFTASGGFGAVRLAYAIDESPSNATLPVSELDVLQSNGSKVIVCTGKKLVINVRNPRPDMLTPISGNTTASAAWRPGRGLIWLNTDNGDVLYTGTSVNHGWLRTYCTMATVAPQSSETSIPAFDVYYKVTFGLRDPA